MLERRVIAFGSNSHGELGFGTSESEPIHEPKCVKFFNQFGHLISQVACGSKHSLVLLDNGSVYSFGSDKSKALGHEKPIAEQPAQVELLAQHKIISVAGGKAHSFALTACGQIFSWGSNAHNALGRQVDVLENGRVVESTGRYPKLIKTLAIVRIVQMATFSEHSLALSDTGQLYAWGRNDFGQAGLGHKGAVAEPILIASLRGVPIRRIAVGAFHSVVITKSCAVFAWGANGSGQLGDGTTDERLVPVNIRTMRKQKVSYAACGQDFTLLLTLDGRVFSCGSNITGQIGHGPKVPAEHHPRQISELMGNTAIQVAAGSRHSVVVLRVDKKGSEASLSKIATFGHGAHGQCGVGGAFPLEGSGAVFHPTTISNDVIESSVHGPLNNSTIKSLLPCAGNKINENTISVAPVTALRVACGGHQTFVIVSMNSGKNASSPTTSSVSTPQDFRHVPRDLRILAVDRQFVDEACSVGRRGANELPSSDEAYSSMYGMVERLFGSIACINASFLLEENDKHSGCGSGNSGLMAQERIREWMHRLLATRFQDIIRQQLAERLLPSLSASPPDVEALRVMLTLPLMLVPTTQVPSVDFAMRYLFPFVKVSTKLNREPERVVTQWLFALGHDFGFYVQLWKNAATTFLEARDLQNMLQSDDYRPAIEGFLKELAYLYHVMTRAHLRLVPFTDFYIPIVADRIRIADDYVSWIRQQNVQQQGAGFSQQNNNAIVFCNYPFVFDSRAKTQLLHTDAILQQHEAAIVARNAGVFEVLARGGGLYSQESEFLNLIVSRHNLVHESITQLMQADERDLKKSLKVWFKHEEAEDSGGVRKEFFLLLMRELLDPKYGMFVVYDETRTIWFNDATFEEDRMFFVIGICCGLAIYNRTIININFPHLIYKKLLGQEVGIDDVADLSPTIHRSLQDIAGYDGADFSDVYALNFTVVRERWGENVVVELKEKGAHTDVTLANRDEYIKLYVEHLLGKSVARQYQAFHDGFHKVVGSGGGRILRLFQPDELEAMVCGNEQYDWNEWERNAVYKDEFNAQHPTIRMFWKAFHNALSDSQRKQFLKFLTGCDRVPIGGMVDVPFIIQPARGANDRHLPVAHTCFNLLDLPLYTDEGELTRKLIYAIEHSEGFGIV